MKRLFLAFTIGFTLMLFLLINDAIIKKAMAADLAPPRIHRSTMVGPTIKKPVAMPLEQCLAAGEEPAPGQTLHFDVSCASKMRWVYQK